MVDFSQAVFYNRFCVNNKKPIWGTSSMDRVADFESVGWGFESLVPHQILLI